MGIRVAHVGSGKTGREALRAILRDPALEPRNGAIVYTRSTFGSAARGR